jgi:putative hemolysin
MGDFGDEFKTADPRPEALPDGRVRLPGQLRLDEAEPWVGVILDGESDTVGGRVTEALGHLPEPGERVEVCGVELVVESVAAHAVTWVIATPLREDDGGDEGEERDG